MDCDRYEVYCINLSGPIIGMHSSRGLGGGEKIVGKSTTQSRT